MKKIIILLCSISFGFKAQNNALNLDGVNDDVRLPYSSALDFSNTSQFSIEAWFKTTATGIATIYSTLVNSQPFNGYDLAITYTKVRFALTNADGTSWILTETVNPFNDGVWHHVACVYKGIPTAANVDIYVDGVLQTQNVIGNNLSGPTTNNQAPHIGSRNNTAYYINGSLDELRIWGKALTASEILSRKNCELTGNESLLLAYYNFNQGTAGGTNAGMTILPDVSGHNLTGTLTAFALNGASSNWVAGPSIISGPCNPVWVKNHEMNSLSILIYPNPGKGMCTVYGLEKGAIMELYNSAGRLIYKSISETDSKINVDITSQPAGMYFVKCTIQPGQVFNKRIVKE